MADKRMTAAEFRDVGYLQEVNRMFLHPLGLALDVVEDEDGSVRFGEVWDCRDDPEGIVFDHFDVEKAHRITREIASRWNPRVAAPLGYRIQPLPNELI